jgi:branched-chain amino acid transport system ATP-binding protein
VSQEPVLKVIDLEARFGGLIAVDGVSLEVLPGEIIGVIGPNGAGKTTFFNCLSGHVRPSKGKVWIAGRDMTARPPHEIARAGLARTFQNLEMFGSMTALETVMVGAHLRVKAGSLSAMLRLTRHWRDERRLKEIALQALSRAGVGDFYDRVASTLSYGQQRRVEIARALALAPKVLLLDEPAAGLSGEEADELVSLVKELASGSLGILLVEHNMRALMGAADRVMVMDSGRQLITGTPEEVRSDPEVIEAYLGKSGALQEGRR